MVLSLRHFSECSYQQIGQILQLDEKTVKSRLFEARHRLRGQAGGIARGMEMKPDDLLELMHEVLDGGASASESRKLDQLLRRIRRRALNSRI